MSNRLCLCKTSLPRKFTDILINSHEILIISCFIIVGFLIYYNVMEGPFVFDDAPSIPDNPNIRITEFTLKGLAEAGVKSCNYMRPVGYITWALNYYVHGYDVMGYHLVNIVIHIINGILLFYLFKSTLGIMGYGRKLHQPIISIAFFAALLWFVHPIQTQSVSYIVQRINSLAAMFYILSFLLYVKARLTERKILKWIMLICCSVSGLIGFGSKEIIATLPVFIFIYEWYFFQNSSPVWLKRYLSHISIVLTLIAAGIFILLGPTHRFILLSGYDKFEFTMVQRVLTEFRVVIYYLTLLIFPHPSRLNLDYYFPVSLSLIDPITTLFSIVTVIGLVVFAFYTAKKSRILSFSILWFLGNLIIESSVIGLDIIFEHRTYLPSMFLCLMVVLLAYRYINAKLLRISILCCVVTACSVWAYERNTVWSDELTLWKDCVKKSPENKRAQYTLGCTLAELGKYDKAIIYYNEALRIKPDYAQAHVNLGIALLAKGRSDEAIEHYKEALRIDPDLAEAHNSMGSALFVRGELNKALESFAKASQLKPEYFQAHNNMGLTLYAVDRIDEAIYHYKEALRLRPDYADAYNNLGAAFIKKRMIDKAAVFFKEALRIDPSNIKARGNLDRCLRVAKEKQ